MVLTGVDVLAPRPVNAARGDGRLDHRRRGQRARHRLPLVRRAVRPPRPPRRRGDDGGAQRRHLPQRAPRRPRAGGRRVAAGADRAGGGRRAGRDRRRAAHRHQRHRRRAQRAGDRRRARPVRRPGPGGREAGLPHDDHAVGRRAARHGRTRPRRATRSTAGCASGGRSTPTASSTSPRPSPTRSGPARLLRPLRLGGRPAPVRGRLPGARRRRRRHPAHREPVPGRPAVPARVALSDD